MIVYVVTARFSTTIQRLIHDEAEQERRARQPCKIERHTEHAACGKLQWIEYVRRRAQCRGNDGDQREGSDRLGP